MRVMALISFFLFAHICFCQEKEDPIIQQLKEIKKTLQEIQETNKKSIDDLDKRLKQLENKPVKGRIEEEPTTSITYGKLKVTNTYVTTVTVTVNGETYKINKNETRTIDVPAGGFVYSVDAVNYNKPVTRYMKANETFNISVYTLPDTVTECLPR